LLATEVLNTNIKSDLRKKFLDLRSQLSLDQLQKLNISINKNLSSLWVEGGGLGSPRRPPRWIGYKAFRNEADPSQAIFEASPFIRWVYPRVLSQTQLEFLEPTASDALWMKSSWGIWEPSPQTSEKVSLENCVGVLVPGVAFDRKGFRLGYGKGHYDRALAGYKGLKVGVAFSHLISESDLPHEGLDIPMDYVVTDSEIIKVNRAND
jgi:5-formyltetrahydrofolate cyclo-ligase